MTATYDIIVIGIGPTRLSAACRLAKSYAAVAVIENAALLRLQTII
jgi:pyruvate/2-oxoglutarate dehydrogenase complex dihydrolipoamide dehydrogenase (E3) component